MCEWSVQKFNLQQIKEKQFMLFYEQKEKEILDMLKKFQRIRLLLLSCKNFEID